MTLKNPHHWAEFAPFDPLSGTVVRSAPGQGAGHWAGAPGVMFDPSEQAFYLTYRLRRPRNEPPDRGYEVHVARSANGIDFEDVWTGRKDQLHTTSIERSALARSGDGTWRLYVSYVDPADARWRIDLVEAARPQQFDLATARPMLTAAGIGAEGVKDPFLFRVAGLWHMVVSFATADAANDAAQLHSTHDAYNTGLIRSRTGLATSEDGLDWHWEGEILAPSENEWDRYCARIGCVWQHEGTWLALYDGSSDVSENYEERCALAFSFDLRRFHKVNRTRPFMTPPQGPAALRYFDVVCLQDALYLYYELALADGSHDLRVLRRPKSR